MRTGSDCLLLLSDALELGLGLASDCSLFLGACVGVERVDGGAFCLVLVEIILKLPLLVQRWTKVISFGHRARHERRGDGDGDAERYVGGTKKKRAARQGASKVANLRLARAGSCVPVPQGFRQDADPNPRKGNNAVVAVLLT